MTRFGYTLMTEQNGPKDFVRNAISAEHSRRQRCRSSPTAGSPWAWVAARTSTSTWSAEVPAITQRQDMLCEAIDIIRSLFGGDLVDWWGDYFQVDSVRRWDLPDVPVGIGVAIGGKKAIDKFSGLADHLIAVEPDGDPLDGMAQHPAGHG